MGQQNNMFVLDYESSRHINVLISRILSPNPKIPYYAKIDYARNLITKLDSYIRSTFLNILLYHATKQGLENKALYEEVGINIDSEEKAKKDEELRKVSLYSYEILYSIYQSIKNNIKIIALEQHIKIDSIDLDNIINKPNIMSNSLVNIVNAIADQIMEWYNDNIKTYYENDDPDLPYYVAIIAKPIVDTLQMFLMN